MPQNNDIDALVERLARAFPMVSHTFHNLSSAVSRVHELTLAQYRLLLYLKDGPACTVNEIASALGIAQSSASELVSRMVNSGLLRREPKPQDRRATQILLSEKARAILQQSASAVEEAMEQLLRRLKQEERQTFVEAFETLASLLKANQPES